MSSNRRSRNNNMERGVLGLNDDDIQEELLNADLKALGINEDDLSNMGTQEKQNLLTALKRSTNPQQQESPHQNKQASCTNNDEPISCDSSPNPRSVSDKNEIDISIDSPEEYPSLPSPSTNPKRCNLQQRQSLRPQQQLQHQQQQHRQQQQQQQQQQPPPPSPKKRPEQQQPVEVITVNSNKDESDGEDNEDDDDEEVEEIEEEQEEEDEDDDDDDQLFNFPTFVDDNGLSLKEHARKKPMPRYIQYYTLPSQSPKESVRLMLKHYNSWYKTWCSLEKYNILPDDNNIFIANLMKNNLKQDVIPCASTSSETTVYSAKVTNDSRNNERTTHFAKSSSPEVEEVEVTEIKTPEASRSTPNAEAKTSPRETRGHSTPTPSSSSSPSVAVNFDEKWDPESGKWTTPQQGGGSVLSTPTSSKRKYVNESRLYLNLKQKSEAKVQCPICQLDFLQSKVESHAAVCEGFPSETRSNPPTYSSKLEESNNKDGFTNTTGVELTNSESKIANKKRGN